MVIDSKKSNGRSILIPLLYLAALAVAGIIFWELWQKYGTARVASFEAEARSSLAKAAEYGDSFGHVNALFSGLAFAGVIITILLQWNELRLQRQEIDESQRTWRDTADAQKRSHEALKEQADSLLLASYLNALAALSQTPAAFSEDQRRALAGIRSLLPYLHERAQSQVGQLAVHRFELAAQDCERMGNRLQKLISLYDHFDEKGLDHIKEAIGDIELEVKLLNSELPEGENAGELIRTLGELLTADVHADAGGIAQKINDAYMALRERVRINVIFELHSLARSCRAEIQGQNPGQPPSR